VVCDVRVDIETLLVIHFMNLKIKSAQFFKGDIGVVYGVCACIHRGKFSCVYEYIHMYCIYKKKVTERPDKRWRWHIVSGARHNVLHYLE
jgi:hypothetical protein